MVSIISKIDKFLEETDPKKTVLQKGKKKIKEITVRTVRLKIIGLLGGRCARCGYRDFRALQIDHINGGGSLEVKTLGQWKMYVSMYKSIVRGERGKYQVLCANCNWIKRHEKREFGNKKITDLEIDKIRKQNILDYGNGLSDVEKYTFRKKTDIKKQPD